MKEKEGKRYKRSLFWDVWIVTVTQPFFFRFEKEIFIEHVVNLQTRLLSFHHFLYYIRLNNRQIKKKKDSSFCIFNVSGHCSVIEMNMNETNIRS